jgi:predicted nucleotidyltransferase component of viral defense system
MSEPSSVLLNQHDDLDYFREAINFTAAQTEFLPRLIEKDYFCSVLLHYLTNADDSLVFKGGTCLTKVHADFYRLSEDLDFAISTSLSALRATRRKSAEHLKAAIKNLPEVMNIFRVDQQLTGANESMQYLAAITYNSLISDQSEKIKIELGLREPLLTDTVQGQARTILLDPVSNTPAASLLPVRCLSIKEAYAEKFRAAMTRRDVAIRDFFDLDYALRTNLLEAMESSFIELVRQKIAVPGNAQIDISADRLAHLQRQIDSDLKSVLRPKDFGEFDLNRAFQYVVEMSKVLNA